MFKKLINRKRVYTVQKSIKFQQALALRKNLYEIFSEECCQIDQELLEKGNETRLLLAQYSQNMCTQFTLSIGSKCSNHLRDVHTQECHSLLSQSARSPRIIFIPQVSLNYIFSVPRVGSEIDKKPR